MLDFTCQNSKELRFYGASGVVEDEVAIGRIYILNGDAGRASVDAALLCLFEPLSFAYVSSYISLNPPIGVIVSSSAVSASILSFLICSKIPYIILNDGPRFTNDSEGRAALLDTSRGMLVIDPQLETLNLYSEKTKDAYHNCKLPLASNISAVLSKSGKSFLINIDMTMSRDEMWEALCTFAESHPSQRLLVPLDVPYTGQEERFCEHMDALFCAAVYGNFSVLLSGVRNEKDISQTLRFMHKAFCRLEEQGREFNGYIKKGVLVDTPMWLFDFIYMQKLDIVCVDLDKIISKLLDIEVKNIILTPRLEESIYRFLKSSSLGAIDADKLHIKSFLPLNLSFLSNDAEVYE